MAYDYAPYPYIAPPGLSGPEPRHPVVIVGAGPIGRWLWWTSALEDLSTAVAEAGPMPSPPPTRSWRQSSG